MWRVTTRQSGISDRGKSYTIVGMVDGCECDYILQDGRAITRNPDGTYLLDETGEILVTGNRSSSGIVLAATSKSTSVAIPHHSELSEGPRYRG